MAFREKRNVRSIYTTPCKPSTNEREEFIALILSMSFRIHLLGQLRWKNSVYPRADKRSYFASIINFSLAKSSIKLLIYTEEMRDHWKIKNTQLHYTCLSFSRLKPSLFLMVTQECAKETRWQYETADHFNYVTINTNEHQNIRYVEGVMSRVVLFLPSTIPLSRVEWRSWKSRSTRMTLHIAINKTITSIKTWRSLHFDTVILAFLFLSTFLLRVALWQRRDELS